jgi:hypothetical protein
VPPVRPPVPAVKNKSWPRNPVDHFILAKLEERGWQPSGQAEKRVLLRRAFLDLTGLPPTLAEQDKFLADNSPDAFARLVDDLLARPSYGERWGRHWLDLARYAETNGYERDAIKPNVWRYATTSSPPSTRTNLTTASSASRSRATNCPTQTPRRSSPQASTVSARGTTSRPTPCKTARIRWTT